MRAIIAIDPSHSGYGIAIAHFPLVNSDKQFWRQPRQYEYLTGTDKSGIGCPNLCEKLKRNTLMNPPDYKTIIVIEEPRSHGNMNPVISLNRDIGYIRCYFKEPTIVLCQASDWKKWLEGYGYLPPKSGNIKPEKYKAILDAHFGIEMVADEWAAWGICLWALENIKGSESE